VVGGFFPFHAIWGVHGFAVWPASRWSLSAGDALTGAHGRDEGVARGAAEQRLNRLLAVIVEAAAEAVGFDGGTVTVRAGDDVGTVAGTDPDLLTLDGAQYSTGDGPCLDALEQDEVVTWTAADDDRRWRAFQEAAEELGIATSLSVPLPIDETMEIAASLNLYAAHRHGPSPSAYCAASRATSSALVAATVADSSPRLTVVVAPSNPTASTAASKMSLNN
jgi:hypothetical protein